MKGQTSPKSTGKKQADKSPQLQTGATFHQKGKRVPSLDDTVGHGRPCRDPRPHGVCVAHFWPLGTGGSFCLCSVWTGAMSISAILRLPRHYVWEQTTGCRCVGTQAGRNCVPESQPEPHSRLDLSEAWDFWAGGIRMGSRTLSRRCDGHHRMGWLAVRCMCLSGAGWSVGVRMAPKMFMFQSPSLHTR